MDWDAIGAIAELIGAIAVVITLVYLAIQVRQSRESIDANTRAIRAQSISDVTRNVHDLAAVMLQGHDVTAVMRKMVTEDELNTDDALLLDMLLSAFFVARQNEYFQWKEGLLEESVFRSLHHMTRTAMGSPSGRHWWEHEGSKFVAPEFARFVEKIIEEGLEESISSYKKAIRIDDDESARGS